MIWPGYRGFFPVTHRCRNFFFCLLNVLERCWIKVLQSPQTVECPFSTLSLYSPSFVHSSVYPLRPLVYRSTDYSLHQLSINQFISLNMHRFTHPPNHQFTCLFIQSFVPVQSPSLPLTLSSIPSWHSNLSSLSLPVLYLVFPSFIPSFTCPHLFFFSFNFCPFPPITLPPASLLQSCIWQVTGFLYECFCIHLLVLFITLGHLSIAPQFVYPSTGKKQHKYKKSQIISWLLALFSACLDVVSVTLWKFILPSTKTLLFKPEGDNLFKSQTWLEPVKPLANDPSSSQFTVSLAVAVVIWPAPWRENIMWSRILLLNSAWLTK